jgi:hypothetical protein
MARLVGYVLMLWLALCGLVVIACLYVAMWLVAIVAAVAMIGFRLARGQRGDDLWRMPFKPHVPGRPAVRQALYSDRG